MARTRDYLGGIVAFEGHSDIVTTQLRLLPTSPHIMILPSIHSYMKHEGDGGDLSVPALIRNAHDALAERNTAARAFLNLATNDNKRLVFVNGGASSAQALCIKAIMKHYTDGDCARAEEILNHVTQNGLSGLERQWSGWEGPACREVKIPRSAEQDPGTQTHIPSATHDESEDPITKAMKAADALDRETENLQEPNELDLTLTSRPRCNSLPLYGYSDGFNDAAPFFVFGAQCRSPPIAATPTPSDLLFSPSTSKFAVTHYDDYTKVQGSHGMAETAFSRYIDQTYGPPTASLRSPMTHEYFTPQTTSFDPRSPETSIFRDSSLHESAGSGGLCPPPMHRRIRSLDRMFPSTPKYGDVGIDDVASSPTAVATPTPRVATFGYKSQSPCSWIALEDGNETSDHEDESVNGAQAIRIRQSRATIIFDPVPKDRKRRTMRSAYVDKGTDAEAALGTTSSFEPLFPLNEDLVVHIKEEVPDVVLDRAVTAAREGLYPVVAKQSNSDHGRSDTEQTTISPRYSVAPQIGPIAYELEAPISISSPPMESEEYDPFAYTQSSRTESKPIPMVHVALERPPTPDMTPPPSIAESHDKFRDFHITPHQTAISVQNALRSLLNEYFPPEAQGYRQYQFSLLPELDGLWEPIFRHRPDEPCQNNRRIDQIIAIGSQKGVKREYSMAVTGQLERLGTKSSGLSRSGRLDFRYLLANAMQRFTMQPLAQQIDNLFENPYLLAILLIPELETYLALHSEVRYLVLDFPPEHLATAISLQQLIGVDAMKVAYIVDSRTSGLPFTHIRGASIDSETPTRRAAINSLLPPPHSKHAHSAAKSDVHMSKANFLLTSRASDEDIATFIATVSKILAATSDFYSPESPVATKQPSPRRTKPAPLQSAFTAFPKPAVAPTTPTTPMPGPSMRSSSPAPSTCAPSVSDTVRTGKTSKSRPHHHTRNKSKASKASRQTKQAADAMSMYTFDPTEDSDYDFEEKRLMPLFLQKPKRRKGDSRKALKFLGLA